MKIEIINDSEFQLISENYQDQLWFKEFMLNAKKNKVDNNMELDFEYSQDRKETENELQGGGYADPEKIVNSHWDVENERQIGVNELKKLTVYSSKI